MSEPTTPNDLFVSMQDLRDMTETVINNQAMIIRDQTEQNYHKDQLINLLKDQLSGAAPIAMILFCPQCGTQHIDEPQPDRGWENPPHRSHECQKCRCVWRPADLPTYGVRSLETAGKADSTRTLAWISKLQILHPEVCHHT